MTQPLVVDEKTIRDTLTEFEDAFATCSAARMSVDAISSSLPWTGEAATRYRNATQAWMDGLRSVEKGLDMLRSAMTQHLGISANTEELNASHAEWHNG